MCYMNRTFKRVWNLVSTVLVVIVVVFAILLVGVRLAGFQTYAVLSGSMEPTYQTGSLIYVKEVAPEDVEVGDPITFVLDENLTVATHRVVAIDEETQHFTTKGDANEYVDAKPVHFKNLLGEPVFTIPKLGYISNFVQNPPGRYVALAAAALIVLLAFVPSLFDDDKSKSNKSKTPRGGKK